MKAEALVPFLSNFLKGAAASDSSASSTTAPSKDTADGESSAQSEAAGGSNDTAGGRPDAPQAVMPDVYDLDLEKVDTLLEEDTVWLVATYAGLSQATTLVIAQHVFCAKL